MTIARPRADLERIRDEIQAAIVRARTTAPIELGGVQIPTASTFELNDEDQWIDPRRDDELRGVD